MKYSSEMAKVKLLSSTRREKISTIHRLVHIRKVIRQGEGEQDA